MQNLLTNQYVVAILWGYFVWGFVAYLLTKTIISKVWEKTTLSYRKINGESSVPFWLDYEKRKPFNWAPRFIGILERIFYTTAIIFNQFSLIGIWIAFKIIGEWSDFSFHNSRTNQDELLEGNTRIRANNFLIGSALSFYLEFLVGYYLDLY